MQVKESEFHSLGLVLGCGSADSPLTTGDGTAAPPRDPIAYRPSAVPGCLLPHVWLDEQTSVYDVLGPGLTVLVDAAADPDLPELLSAVDAVGEVPVVVRPVQAETGSAALAVAGRAGASSTST